MALRTVASSQLVRLEALSSAAALLSVQPRARLSSPPLPQRRSRATRDLRCRASLRRVVVASSADVVTGEAAASSPSSSTWLPLIPMETLPKGERRLVKADGQTVLLLWYRNEIFAVENSSPAEGAYAEGLFNARLTQDGCVVCPLTESTFDLRTGEIKEWYPNNPLMRFLTRPLRSMRVYPTKIDNFQICINLAGSTSDSTATEVVFAKSGRVGQTATDLAVDEVRMVVDDSASGFGFNAANELVNGRAAMAGFFCLIVIELTTGKGLLGATGLLDFIYSLSS